MLSHISNAQKTKIYMLPGLGSNARLFDSLKFDLEKYEPVVLQYGTPLKGDSMANFAQRLSLEIDQSRPFILLGTSLGGMLCVELAHILKPIKTIIISSAKGKHELPKRYKIQRYLGIYKIIPPFLYKLSSTIMQPLVEPDRKRFKSTFVDMLQSKESLYLKRAVAMILNWDRTLSDADIVHIHGTNDHTVPYRNVQPTCTIQGGSHMMTLSSFEKIQEVLDQILD
jgi:pimeloyl-ACP methyl ester carboxylesterase